MKRRTLIRNFVVFTAGAALLPSCAEQETKATIPLKNISISGEQEKLLEALSETIIPRTATPGAKDLASHLFVLMMVDDCFNAEERQKFVKGLTQFDEMARKKSGTNFVRSSPEQKKALLSEIESKKGISPELLAFYAASKRLTIQSFTSSQYYLTKIQVYEMVPGRYHGCVPVKNNSNHG